MQHLRAVALFLAGNVAFSAGLFFHAFLFNFYLIELGFGAVEWGLAAAALTAGGLIGLVPAGRLVDRIGASKVLVIASIVAFVGLSLSALARSMGGILAYSLVAGFGTALWRVSGAPLVMTLVEQRFRERIFSVNVGLMVGAGGVWIAVAGFAPEWIETALGGGTRLWATRYALLGGAAVTAASVLAFGVVASGSYSLVSQGPRESARLSLTDTDLLLLVGAIACWMLGPALVAPFFNVYFTNEHGVDVSSVGVIFAVSHGVTALVIFASGELARRRGTRVVLIAWMASFAPLLTGLALADSVFLAVTLYLLQGFVSPATNPLIDQVVMELAPPDKLGLASSWRNVATELAGVTGAAIGGRVLAGMGFVGLFAVTAAVGVAAAATFTIVMGRLARPQAEDATDPAAVK